MWAMVLTCVIMLAGSVFLSMPLSVIGAEFAHVWQEKEARDREKVQRGMTYSMASYRKLEAEDEEKEGKEADKMFSKPVNLGR